MRRGHAIALVGALALILVVGAVDWYGTELGDEAQRIEEATDDASGAEAGEVDRRLNEEGEFISDRETDKAWEADAVIDRVILGLLLLTILLTVATVLARSAGGRATKGLGPPGLSALAATIGAILVAYRIVQEPGLDEGTTVKIGPLLALFALAAIAIGMSSALRQDEEETSSGERPARGD